MLPSVSSFNARFNSAPGLPFVAFDVFSPEMYALPMIAWAATLTIGYALFALLHVRAGSATAFAVCMSIFPFLGIKAVSMAERSKVVWADLRTIEKLV